MRQRARPNREIIARDRLSAAARHGHQGAPRRRRVTQRAGATDSSRELMNCYDSECAAQTSAASGIYGVISICLFFAVFIGVLVWALLPEETAI